MRDGGGGVLADVLQDIGQIGVGVDVVQSAGGEQALDDADLLGAELGGAAAGDSRTSR